MDRLKKIEIIIESVKVRKIIEILESLSVSGYTVIEGATGRGASGLHDGLELTNVSHNSYFIIVAHEHKAEEIIHAVRPLHEKFGGICFVSNVDKVAP